MNRAGWRGLALALALLAGRAGAEPLAEINGRTLDRATFEALLEQRYGYAFVETAILSQLILAAAEQAGLTPTPTELDLELDRFLRENFRYGDERYRRWRTDYAKQEPTLREEIRVQVAQFKLRTRGVALDEAALKTWFEANKELYERPESVVFRQLLVPRRGEPAGGTWPASEALAREILARLAGGMAFAEAARTYSDDPAAVRTGGLVGPTPVARLAGGQAALLATLDRLQPDQLAEAPVLVGDRYVLVQLVERLPAVPADFARQRRLIEVDYLAERMQPQEEFLGALLHGAKITLLDPRYRELPLTGRWVSPSGLYLRGWLRDTP